MSIYEDLQERLEDVHLYNGGLSFWSLCPFHEDTKPSFAVYEDADKPEGQGRFYCSGCGKSGTHSFLWKHLTGSNAKVSVYIPDNKPKFLPKWARWQEQYGSIENLAKAAHNNVQKFPDTHAWYLKRRGLLPIADKALLGMKDGWATFPIFDQQGKVIDIICRNTQKVGETKYVIRPNDEETPLLYVPNWARVMSSKQVFIVYGIIDALSLEMCEMPVITGSTGKSLSAKRLISLNKRYVIIPDLGEEEAARNLAMTLGNFTHILRLKYENEEKDPDGVRMNRGEDALKQLIIGENK